MTTTTNIIDESEDSAEKEAILARLSQAKKKLGRSSPRIPAEEPLWVLRKFEQLLNIRLHMVVNQRDDGSARTFNPALQDAIVEFCPAKQKGVLCRET